MKRLLILLFGVALSMAPTFSGWAATPIVEYLFNEAGDSPPSTGSSDIRLVLVQKGAAAAELPSAAGKGVRGGTDRCLDQCLVEEPVRAWAALAEPDETLNGLLSFTLMGWFKKVGAPLSCDHHLFWMGEKNRFLLMGWDNAGMRLGFNGKNAYSGPNAYAGLDDWIFFAVTYDGTLEKQNVGFYKGTLSEGARLIGKVSFFDGAQGGAIQEGSVRLQIGGVDAVGRCFKGFLDELRVFGSTKDASGVLETDDIRQWQDNAKPTKPRK